MTTHIQDSSQPFRWHYDEFDDGNFQIRGRTLFFILVIISVVLLATLLFVYTRWVCRFIPPPPPPPPATSSSAAVPPPVGLDIATIEKIPVVIYTKTVAESEECCICLGVFEEMETVKVLPKCEHCFHNECVDKWLAAQPSCPLCRGSLLLCGDDSLV